MNPVARIVSPTESAPVQVVEFRVDPPAARLNAGVPSMLRVRMTRMSVPSATNAWVLRLWISPVLRRKLSPLVQYTLKGGKVLWLGSAVAVLVTTSGASAAAITASIRSGAFMSNPLVVGYVARV